MGAQVPVELKLLVVAVLIGFVQIVWATVAGAGGERDFAWLAGPRDETKPVGLVAARLDRALKNFLETFPFFAAAVLAVTLAKAGTAHTALGAMLYFWARLVYLPVYVTGIPYLRTLVWAVSLWGLLQLLWALI